MKLCRICKEEKSTKKMVHNKAFKDGIDTICLDCSRQKVKEWRKHNKRPVSNRKQSSTSYRSIIIDFLIKRDGFICGFCKESLEGQPIHINHITPVALGGLDIMENINLAHESCNVKDAQRVIRKLNGIDY